MKLTKFLTDSIGRTVDAEFIKDLAKVLYAVNRHYSIDDIPRQTHGNYCFCAVHVDDFLSDWKQLHLLHWDETEKHVGDLCPNADYDFYRVLVESGRMILFAVLHEGEMVGYCPMKLEESMHTQQLVAYEDALFLRKDHRGKGTAMRFVKYVENVLRDLGVTEIRVSSKLVNGSDKFMVKAGFKPVATQLIKMLRDEDVQVRCA